MYKFIRMFSLSWQLIFQQNYFEHYFKFYMEIYFNCGISNLGYTCPCNIELSLYTKHIEKGVEDNSAHFEIATSAPKMISTNLQCIAVNLLMLKNFSCHRVYIK